MALDNNEDATNFRISILKRCRHQKGRVAWMPGVSLDMLGDLAHTDYEEISSSCEALRLPLLLGKKVEIRTIDKHKRNHILEFELKGWDSAPIMGNGIVDLQSYANIPFGETFVAPRRDTANGTIVINGSIKNHVFLGNDQIILKFKQGKLIEISPTNHHATALIQNAIKMAINNGDQEPDYLGEFGVGVNSTIQKLRGVPLFDEKAINTAHIAIGANAPFGGEIKATHLHEDLIFRRPTILIDQRSILSEGKICVVDQDWRHNFRKLTIKRNQADNPKVCRTPKFAEQKGGLCYRVYYDGRDSKCTVPVGNIETANLAWKIYKELPELFSNHHDYHDDDQWVHLPTLIQKLEVSEDDILRVLSIMENEYQLVITRQLIDPFGNVE